MAALPIICYYNITITIYIKDEEAYEHYHANIYIMMHFVLHKGAAQLWNIIKKRLLYKNFESFKEQFKKRHQRNLQIFQNITFKYDKYKLSEL